MYSNYAAPLGVALSAILATSPLGATDPAGKDMPAYRAPEDPAAHDLNSPAEPTGTLTLPQALALALTRKEPDPMKLVGYSLTFQDLLQALECNNVSTGAGYIEHQGKSYLVRADGRVTRPEQIGTIVVGTRDGVPLYIQDLAEVRIGNRTRLVDATIRTVRNNLLEGAILVIAVLFLILGNIRVALITTLVIPLSMLLVMLASVVLFAGALVLFARLGQEFVPTFDEKNIAAQAMRVPSTSLSQSQEMQFRAEKVVWLSHLKPSQRTVNSGMGRNP